MGAIFVPGLVALKRLKYKSFLPVVVLTWGADFYALAENR